MPISEVKCCDCMDFMAKFPDKFFDLAIVDPPYGIGISNNAEIGYKGSNVFKPKPWDNQIPNQEYFDELFRVSKNQIIWGGNYFPLPPTKHFIFWDKMNPEGLSFSDGEMAWTSFNRAIRKWSRRNAIDGKIHPTQKPIELYDWIFANYAKQNDKILDTHLGSGSSRIAAYKAKLDFTGYEIDAEYFEAQEKRFQIFTAQGTLF